MKQDPAKQLRAYELAKELKLKVNDFLERARKEGFSSLKSNFSVIDDKTAAALRTLFAPKHKPPRVKTKNGTKEFVPSAVVAPTAEPTRPPEPAGSAAVAGQPAAPPREKKRLIALPPFEKAAVGQLIRPAPQPVAPARPAPPVAAPTVTPPKTPVRFRPPASAAAAPPAAPAPPVERPATKLAEKQPAAARLKEAREAEGKPPETPPHEAVPAARPAEPHALPGDKAKPAPAVELKVGIVPPPASTVEIITAPHHERIEPAPEREIRALRPHEVELLTRFTDEEARERRRGRGAHGQPRARIEERQPVKAVKKHKEDPRLLRKAFIERLSRSHKKAPAAKPAESKLQVTVPISVRDLSQLLSIKTAMLIQKLMSGGAMANINTLLDEEQTVLLGLEFGRDVEVKKQESIAGRVAKLTEMAGAAQKVARSPIVTMLGHVDHGKTSLLDRIRNANVAATESGGITQHIGAYKVVIGGKSVVFLDTPGHEAFSKMRARGANVTDVAVLVVAADDGVMPQTEEAISHAKLAGVAFVVALNKMDKKEANPHKVKQQLSGLGLLAEDWGGKVGMVPVSAVTGAGIDALIERIALEAEMLDLKASPDIPGRGAVLEAHVHEGRGVTATILVRDGSVRLGDPIWCGRTYGRVRAMLDDKGKRVSAAGPSTPVLVTGLLGLPEAGDLVFVVKDIQVAKELAEATVQAAVTPVAAARPHVTLENLFANLEAGKAKEARIVLKTDVSGSLEALRTSLEGLSTAEVKLRIIHGGVGAVNESDVLLADVADALVISFRVPVEERAQTLAAKRSVDVRTYDVIYKLIEDMGAALEGLLEPERVEVSMGTAVVKEVFKITRIGTVAGCLVHDGKVERTSLVRVFRAGEKVFEGKIESLKRFKEDVKEIAAGLECGIRLAGFDSIQAGDTIQSLQVQQIARKLRG